MHTYVKTGNHEDGDHVNLAKIILNFLKGKIRKESCLLRPNAPNQCYLAKGKKEDLA